MRYKSIFLVLILCLFFLTGCSNSAGVETRAYVVALGIDNGESKPIKLSLQIAILNSTDQSTGSPDENSSIISVECSDIDSGISLINSYISKQIDLSHCKAIIMSEELSATGVSKYIYTLANNVEVRPGCNIIISKCSASDFLNNFKPVLESVQSNYYESILNSAEYTGYIDDLHLSNFYSALLSTSSQAIAILGGISSGEDVSEDSEYIAGKTSIKGKNNIENFGTAVFKEDKLVGELNNIETLCHLIVTNHLENATITIPNPLDHGSDLSIYIHLNKNTENKVKLVNNYPYIESEIQVTGNVLSFTKSLDLIDKETLDIINASISTYLEENITSYLYKTSKEFHSDIAGFGKYLLPKYLTWQDWIDSDWNTNYENAFFNVTVKTNIQSGYLYNKV